MLRIQLVHRIPTVSRLLTSSGNFIHPIFQVRRMATDTIAQLNRLATAKSPYLRQHATNPVDWYPFEKEALDKAKAEDKVLCLSICHINNFSSYSCQLDIVRVTGTPPFPFH